MTRYFVTMETEDPHMYELLKWIQKEWDYAMGKFGTTVYKEEDEDLAELAVTERSWWYNQVIQYIGRARDFGLGTYRGRQAVAKTAVTSLAMVASVIRVHGPLPDAGTPSGYVFVDGKELDERKAERRAG